jgi:hypothetical protein
VLGKPESGQTLQGRGIRLPDVPEHGLALVTHTFDFIDYDAVAPVIDRWYLCRETTYEECFDRPESATVHNDCFRIFLRYCTTANALHRLWRFAAWRMPWKRAPPSLLPEDFFVPGSTILAEVSSLYGVPLLQRLPSEVVRMIGMEADSPLFWRISVAMALALEFSSSPPTKLVTVPLSDLRSWSRNGEAAISRAEAAHLPIVRLTIDCRGLKSVERFPVGQPAFCYETSVNEIFVLKHQDCFRDAYALLQVRYIYT